jgi:hypothetical protein
MSFCAPNKIFQKFFAKFSKNCLYLQFKLFICSPYYLGTTSLNGHKLIILSIGKKSKKRQCQFWEFRGDCLFSGRPSPTPDPQRPCATVPILNVRSGFSALMISWEIVYEKFQQDWMVKGVTHCTKASAKSVDLWSISVDLCTKF